MQHCPIFTDNCCHTGSVSLHCTHTHYSTKSLAQTLKAAALHEASTAAAAVVVLGIIIAGI
jgi:hypothetical protein